MTYVRRIQEHRRYMELFTAKHGEEHAAWEWDHLFMIELIAELDEAIASDRAAMDAIYQDALR